MPQWYELGPYQHEGIYHIFLEIFVTVLYGAEPSYFLCGFSHQIHFCLKAGPTRLKFVPFCSSSLYHYHISVPLCGNVWRLRPWLDHVPICFVVGAEWKEIAKLQRRGRGKHQLTEDSVFNVGVSLEVRVLSIWPKVLVNSFHENFQWQMEQHSLEFWKWG